MPCSLVEVIIYSLRKLGDNERKDINAGGFRNGHFI